MKLSICMLTVLFLVTAACGDKGEGDLGQQLSGAVSDTQVMKEAQAAANQIIRNQSDCEMVKSNIEDANRKLAEAERQVKTSTGRTTLEALKKQVKRIAETCGVM